MPESLSPITQALCRLSMFVWSPVLRSEHPNSLLAQSLPLDCKQLEARKFAFFSPVSPAQGSFRVQALSVAGGPMINGSSFHLVQGSGEVHDCEECCVRPWVGTESASSGLVLEPYASIVNFGHCFLHTVIYMHVPIMHMCNTHAHNLHSLFSQLLLLSSPSALDCLWSYGCYHTLCIHLDLFPSPYNVFHSHSSGPFALLFCLLFLLLSRLLQAPPNRLSIGIQRLTLTVQVLNNGNVQCFPFFFFF